MVCKGKTIIIEKTLQIVVMSIIPTKKLSINAQVSVKKNKAASDPLIIAGWILVTNKNNATGRPPKVEKPLTIPEIIPVTTFEIKLLIFKLVYPFISNNEKKITTTQIIR